MENLKRLVEIDSSQNGDEIIDYLKNRFEKIAQEVLIVKNKETDSKSLLVGINTPLRDVWPHHACRTH